MPTPALEIQAILFDFDGVLVNSEPLHCRAFQQTLRREQIQLSSEEYYSDLIGFDDRGAIAFLFQKRNRPLDHATLERIALHKSLAVAELIRSGEFHALKGVDAFVRGAAAHYPLGICSGALGQEIRTMLGGIGLGDYFQTIVAAEDVSVGKPDPSGYLLAARLLGQKIGKPLAPPQCLVIEDAPVVIQRVRNAGFPVLGVATTYPLQSLAAANYVVESLEPAQVRRAIPQLHING